MTVVGRSLPDSVHQCLVRPQVRDVRHFVVVNSEERGVVPLDADERKVIVVEDGRVAAITENDFSQVHAARKSRDTG